MGKFANQPVRGNTAARQRAVTLASRIPHGGYAIEVGTMTGNMAVELKSMRSDVNLICVDNWLAKEDQPERYKQTLDDNALKTAETTRSHKRTAYERFGSLGISVINMESVNAAALFADRSVDCIFIDADHSYDGVLSDIQAWRDKVKTGGWLGGHDYKNIDPRFGGVDRAVNTSYPEGVETDLNYTWWTML